MRVMIQVLKFFLGKFVVMYFDDILIYSSSETEHLQHLREVFTILQANKLYINLKKVQLHDYKPDILKIRHQFTRVHVHEEKVRAIRDWPTPKGATEVRSFHELAIFYRRFVRNCSTLVVPMTDCLKQKGSFCLDRQNRKSFCTHQEEAYKHPVLVFQILRRFSS